MEQARVAAFANVLEGKRALVIGGGGGGIGRAVTNRLAAAGSAVAVGDVDPQRAQEAAGGGVALSGDVRARGTAEQFVRDAAEQLGGLEILVTVVGGQLAFAPAALVHEITGEDWDLMFELNLRYVAESVPAAVQVFLEQRSGGAIVSVGSIAGLAGSPMQAAYGAAKAGLASLARSVAAEYGRDAIRMNVVACGPIATPVAAAAQAAAPPNWIPLGRAGTAEEVANAVVFLASPLSSYISGHILVVDGGATAAGPFPPPR